MSWGSAPLGRLVGFVTPIVPLGPAPVHKSPADSFTHEISESADRNSKAIALLIKLLEEKGLINESDIDELLLEAIH